MTLAALLAFDFTRIGPFVYALFWLLTTLSASLVKDGETKKARSRWWLAYSAVHWGSGLIALAMIWPRR